MKRSEVKLLLVDDDSSFGRAMQEWLRRSGYQVQWARNPREALSLAQSQHYDVVIMDCLLPRSNGVDLAQVMQQSQGEHLQIIMMSGIYRDRSFIREAITKTRAAAFLSKPFDGKTLLATLDNICGIDSTRAVNTDDPLCCPDWTTEERLKFVKSRQSVHGYELPLLYTMIFGSSISGRLHLVTARGDDYVLTFHYGELTNVHVRDQASYFGALLVDMGFTTADAVVSALSRQGNTLGDRLVEAHSLSPHAINIVREEQMLIRLSNTIHDSFVQVNFVESETRSSDVTVNRSKLATLIREWTRTKISADWLKRFFSSKESYKFEVLYPDQLPAEIMDVPEMRWTIGLIAAASKERKYLSSITETLKEGDARFFSCLYYLILEGWVWFQTQEASAEEDRNRTKEDTIVLETDGNGRKASGERNVKFKNEDLFEHGMRRLRAGDYRSAREIFSRLTGQNAEIPSLNLYLAWAKIKSVSPNHVQPEYIKRLGTVIYNIPLNERQSAAYFFVKGSYFRLIGDLDRAKKHLKTALSIDAHFVDARREMLLVKEEIRRHSTLNFLDISSVIEFLLGRH